MKTSSLGFSLFEMSIGLVVIGILASVGTSQTRIYTNHFKHAKDKANIAELNKLIIGYY